MAKGSVGSQVPKSPNQLPSERLICKLSSLEHKILIMENLLIPSTTTITIKCKQMTDSEQKLCGKRGAHCLWRCCTTVESIDTNQNRPFRGFIAFEELWVTGRVSPNQVARGAFYWKCTLFQHAKVAIVWLWFPFAITMMITTLIHRIPYWAVSNNSIGQIDGVW